MPGGDNQYKKLGWYPVSEITDWVRKVSDRNKLSMSDVLNRMAAEYIANHDPRYYRTHLAPDPSSRNEMTYEGD